MFIVLRDMENVVTGSDPSTLRLSSVIPQLIVWVPASICKLGLKAVLRVDNDESKLSMCLLYFFAHFSQDFYFSLAKTWQTRCFKAKNDRVLPVQSENCNSQLCIILSNPSSTSRATARAME